MLFGVALILIGIIWFFVCVKTFHTYSNKHIPEVLEHFVGCDDVEAKKDIMAFGFTSGIMPMWLRYMAYPIPIPVFITLGIIIFLSKLLL